MSAADVPLFTRPELSIVDVTLLAEEEYVVWKAFVPAADQRWWLRTPYLNAKGYGGI